MPCCGEIIYDILVESLRGRIAGWLDIVGNIIVHGQIANTGRDGSTIGDHYLHNTVDGFIKSDSLIGVGGIGLVRLCWHRIPALRFQLLNIGIARKTTQRVVSGSAENFGYLNRCGVQIA
jgi:hypothetical protein